MQMGFLMVHWTWEKETKRLSVSHSSHGEHLKEHKSLSSIISDPLNHISLLRIQGLFDSMTMILTVWTGKVLEESPRVKVWCLSLCLSLSLAGFLSLPLPHSCSLCLWLGVNPVSQKKVCRYAAVSPCYPHTQTLWEKNEMPGDTASSLWDLNRER